MPEIFSYSIASAFAIAASLALCSATFWARRRASASALALAAAATLSAFKRRSSAIRFASASALSFLSLASRICYYISAFLSASS